MGKVRVSHEQMLVGKQTLEEGVVRAHGLIYVRSPSRSVAASGIVSKTQWLQSSALESSLWSFHVGDVWLARSGRPAMPQVHARPKPRQPTTKILLPAVSEHHGSIKAPVVLSSSASVSH